MFNTLIHPSLHRKGSLSCTFSRHGKTQASLALPICLIENVLFRLLQLDGKGREIILFYQRIFHFLGKFKGKKGDIEKHRMLNKTDFHIYYSSYEINASKAINLYTSKKSVFRYSTLIDIHREIAK